MQREPASANLSTDIFQVIKNRIIEWKYLPNQRLTEIGLCEEFGVSRSPVREALKMLEENGLVKKEPRQGYMVRQLDLSEIHALYEFRLALERYVVERLAEDGLDESTWQRLNSTWQACLQEKFNPEREYYRLDEQFHEALAHSLGNAVIHENIRSINERLHFIRVHDITSYERLAVTCQQHLGLLEAIHNKDKEGAKKYITNNIHEGLLNVENAIREALASAYL